MDARRSNPSPCSLPTPWHRAKNLAVRLALPSPKDFVNLRLGHVLLARIIYLCCTLSTRFNTHLRGKEGIHCHKMITTSSPCTHARTLIHHSQRFSPTLSRLDYNAKLPRRSPKPASMRFTYLALQSSFSLSPGILGYNLTPEIPFLWLSLYKACKWHHSRAHPCKGPYIHVYQVTSRLQPPRSVNTPIQPFYNLAAQVLAARHARTPHRARAPLRTPQSRLGRAPLRAPQSLLGRAPARVACVSAPPRAARARATRARAAHARQAGNNLAPARAPAPSAAPCRALPRRPASCPTWLGCMHGSSNAMAHPMLKQPHTTSAHAMPHSSALGHADAHLVRVVRYVTILPGRKEPTPSSVHPPSRIELHLQIATNLLHAPM